MADIYDTLSHPQLVNLLRRRDADRKLGLVWERHEIEGDAAVDAAFVAARLDPALSDGAPPWDNLVIEGDNHEALRWLRMTHAGQVRCIYIDPPYNTGNRDWVYNDHYVERTDRYRHSTWLEFLYRRLLLARDLLARDGVLLVSINDENRARLDLLLDEVMPGMRLGSFVWRTRQGSNADQGAFLSPDHEHVLVYGQPGFRFAGVDKSYEMYANPDNDPNGDWQKSDLTLGFNHVERPNLYYPLQDPATGIWYACNPNSVWRYATRARLKPGQRLQSRPMEEWIERGQILFPTEQRVATWPTREALLAAIRAGDVPMTGRAPMLREDLPDLDFWIGRPVGFGTPRFKRYRRDLRNATQPLSSWITPRAEEATRDPHAAGIVAGTNDEGAKAIKEIFGEKAFNYAKPVSLIRELIRQSTGPDDLVVDFFAGSATTAQAVMELNAADQGSRRFILVSSTEATAADPERNLCRDVTAQRIRRLNALTGGRHGGLSAPFAYLRLRPIAPDAITALLEPAEAWHALAALHGLPLTPYSAAAGWAEQTGRGQTLILADRTTAALIARLRELAATRTPAFVYSWAPGQLRTALGPVDFEIRPVRETLVQRCAA